MKKSSSKSSPGKAQSQKPEKPYPDFPLSPHASGKWVKRIRGKLYYFARWAKTVGGKLERIPGDGWKEALEIYKAQAGDLHVGRTPRASSGGLDVKELCNRFLTAKQQKMDSGELTARTFAEYRKTTDRLIANFGSTRLVADLASDDFARLRVDISKTWGVYRLADGVQKVRTVFKWAYESGLIDHPMRFGADFKKPSQATIRKHRATSETKLFTAGEIRTLLAAATPVTKSMILLAINCGFGNSDCAQLPQKALDLDGGWVRFDRPKTGVVRRAPLWPETIAALKEAIRNRPYPDEKEHAGLVFLTCFGRPWVRVRKDGKQAPIDAVGLQFAKLVRQCKIQREGVGFYSLRHTFRTVADNVRDETAIRLCMGHSDSSIDARYVEQIDDARLLAVANYVRSWLHLPKPAGVKRGFCAK